MCILAIKEVIGQHFFSPLTGLISFWSLKIRVHLKCFSYLIPTILVSHTWWGRSGWAKLCLCPLILQRLNLAEFNRYDTFISFVIGNDFYLKLDLPKLQVTLLLRSFWKKRPLTMLSTKLTRKSKRSLLLLRQTETNFIFYCECTKAKTVFLLS